MKGTKKIGMNDKDVEEAEEVYFFDTYAFFEIIEGNPNYLPYQNVGVVTTIFNLAELNYNLKKEMDKDKADEITKKYWDFLVSVAFEDLKKAMDLKIKHKKLSIPDAIGYIAAKKHNVKFLTGDSDFEDSQEFDNVKFVK